MCAQHHLLGVPAEGQLLVLLYSVKVGLDSRRYDNRNTFFPLVLGGKEKRSIFKMFLFDFLKMQYFENRLMSTTLSQVAASKTTRFLENT